MIIIVVKAYISAIKSNFYSNLNFFDTFIFQIVLIIVLNNEVVLGAL
jgi:hypothetical protein